MTTEERLTRLEHTVMGWDIYLRDIKANQKFYLEKRMPLRAKHDNAYQNSLKRLEALYHVLGELDVSFKKGYGDLTLFICNKNQARKLRKIADQDLRIDHAWKEQNKNNGEKDK